MNRFVTLANGAKLPTLGLGTYKVSLLRAGHVEALFTYPLHQSSHLIRPALECGYREFDCAPLYGNQSEIGFQIEKAISDKLVKREELFVTSKLPMNGMRREKVEYFLRKSLKELRIDFVDLYLIHAPFAVKYVKEDDFYPIDPVSERLQEDDVDFCETWKEMERMVNIGLAKSIGISNFNIDQISRIIQIATIKPLVLQIELHGYFQQKQLVQFCNRNNIAVQAFASLGSPLTAAKQNNSILLNDPILKQIGNKYNKTSAQVMLRWLTQTGISAVPKSCDESQLQENINVFDFKLTEEDDSLIRSIDKGERIFWFEYAKGYGKTTIDYNSSTLFPKQR